MTHGVGEISEARQRLLAVTKQALFAGLEFAKPLNRLSDISHAIEQFVLSQGFSVVKDFTGHGIGTKMHEDPMIPNYGKPGYGPILKTGMTLAIEPMVNAGKEDVRILKDDWTQ